jgi:hypothetical protein|tara:strand:- start:956 stop:1210 length:255 start_codon:yes stop_codon:yes gene_type:complete
MIDTTLLVYLCISAIGLIILTGIELERRDQKVIATLNGVLEREILRELRSRGIRAKFVEGNLVDETGPSKAHEEANHAIEEITC